ncbi:Ubiquitin fusion degradation UFD1 family protein [Theobroma cacao]|uniref:Ubiquitin fusion degradation UFD1 family protein n=1 Tax=Theobroma cacao TaxID=3641 RepID=A0A061FUQ7_THECC|nr:Ubiquitin fusion degradation UFD1 family protein [Theobroma cacao]
MERSDLEAVAAAAAAAMELDSSFQLTYRCSASRVELGNRILMPLSAFDSLVDKGVESPWLFELCNPVTGKTSHCGVLEFTSDEGFVLLPAPMMESMELEEGELATLKSASLDKGTFLKLQPHTKNFMQLSDPKAVLEKAFRDFCCLTTGDTIMIMHNDIKLYIDIVEAKPSLAVNIIDTDCEVDFALPLDYEPPQKKQKKAKLLQKQEQPIEAETVKFKAFNGIARRLDGEPVTEQVAVDDDHDSMMNAERKPCGSKKVVLGSNVIQCQEDSTGEPSRKGWQEVTNMKKEEEKFQPFTGRSYRLT